MPLAFTQEDFLVHYYYDRRLSSIMVSISTQYDTFPLKTDAAKINLSLIKQHFISFAILYSLLNI